PRLLKIVTTDGRLTQAALLDFFKSCSIQDINDIVALAFLTFLYGVLIPGGGRSIVDNRFLYLADDLKAWDNFPWGRLCYEKTKDSLSKAVPKGLLQKGRVKTYTLGGFSYALQVFY